MRFLVRCVNSKINYKTSVCILVSKSFNTKCWVLFKSSSVSQSASQSSNPGVQRKSSHGSDRKGSRRRMDTEERKDKGMLFHYWKADAGDLFLA